MDLHLNGVACQYARASLFSAVIAVNSLLSRRTVRARGVSNERARADGGSRQRDVTEALGVGRTAARFVGKLADCLGS